MENLVREQADKVYAYKTYTPKRKVDQLLFINADQYCNLGTDSTKKEREIAESNSRYIYRLIKNLDESTGKLLLRYREE